jgi:DNA (cytosine-5)-methyltransferase 1
MSPFSELRSELGLSESHVRELLGISAEKFTAYECGFERPPVREIQALRGLSSAICCISAGRDGVSQGAFGFVSVPLVRDRVNPRPAKANRAVARASTPRLRLISPSRPERQDRAASFKFIDLFAGIGGMRLGFEAIGGRCEFTCEWDRYSQKTYRANFPGDDHEIAGDIRNVDAKDIPEHDILLAGFPCQPFSIAGVSKKNALNRPHGFACEAQGTLFFEVARIIAHHQPRAFLLENVKNLVNHDSGRTFQVIRDVLERQLKYRICPKVIDAQSWVPQHRERIFIAGFRDEVKFSFDDLEIPDAGPRLSSVLHPEDGSEKEEQPFTSGPLAKVSDKYSLTTHLWNYLRDYAAKHRELGNGFGFGLFGPNDIARTLSARYFKDGSEILIRRRLRNPRRLTPRECARLMGFDAPGKSGWKIPVSDTQAYKQFGNAVVVPVIKAVAEHMGPHILDGTSAEAKKRASG